MSTKISPRKFLNAAGADDLETVKNYLSQGGDANYCSKDGESAWSLALMMGHEQIVHALMDSQADINVVLDKKEGTTPLHEAASNGLPKIIEKLLSKGADVNKIIEGSDRLTRGRTPLMNACYGFRKGNVKASIQVLLKHGANPNAQDAKGQTALIHVVELMKLREATSMFGDLAGARKPSSLADVFSLFKNIVNSSTKLVKGDCESLEIVQMLVDAGADVNLKDRHGRSALKIALENGSTEMVELLTKLGAEKLGVATKIAGEDDQLDVEEDAFQDALQDARKWRGLVTEDVNEFTLLVKAPIENVTDAFAQGKKATRIDKNIRGKEVLLGEECYVVYQLEGHQWTLIEALHGGHSKTLEPQDAKLMSKNLKTKAIDLKISDTAYSAQYKFFENGDLIEQYEFGEKDSAEDDEDIKVVFESKVRKCDKEDLNDGMNFVDAFLKAQDACVFGWSEGARTHGSKPGKKRVVDLDLGSSGNPLLKMDFVLVK